MRHLNPLPVCSNCYVTGSLQALQSLSGFWQDRLECTLILLFKVSLELISFRNKKHGIHSCVTTTLYTKNILGSWSYFNGFEFLQQLNAGCHELYVLKSVKSSREHSGVYPLMLFFNCIFIHYFLKHSFQTLYNKIHLLATKFIQCIIMYITNLFWNTPKTPQLKLQLLHFRLVKRVL